MSFTPLLATRTEVMLFNKHIIAGDSLGLDTATEFTSFQDIVHEAAEAQILQYLNWTDMDSTDLSTDTGMRATLKMATIKMVTNAFTSVVQAKTGSVIDLGDMVVKVVEYVVMTKEIKEMLQPYINFAGTFGTVDPDEDYT